MILYSFTLNDSIFFFSYSSCKCWLYYIDSKQGLNPLDGWSPSIPDGQAFELGTDEYKSTEKLGLSQLGKVGFVLVAGGLGERLGYNGTKVNNNNKKE